MCCSSFPSESISIICCGYFSESRLLSSRRRDGLSNQYKKTFKLTCEMGKINLKGIVFYVPLCRAKLTMFIIYQRNIGFVHTSIYQKTQLVEFVFLKVLSWNSQMHVFIYSNWWIKLCEWKRSLPVIAPFPHFQRSSFYLKFFLTNNENLN